MKKILVPTDFSEYSKKSFQYIREFSSHVEVEIILLHCYHVENSIGINPSKLEISDIESVIRNNDLERFNQLLNSYSKNNKCTIRIELERGLPAECIQQVVDRENVDLVVMGTNAEKSIVEKVFGSVTDTTIKQLKCPVLLVPVNNKSEGVNTITYFNPLVKNEDATLRQLALFSEAFMLSLHCIFVSPDGLSKELYDEMSAFKKEMFSSPLPGISYVEILENKYPREAIVQYINQYKPEVIAIDLDKQSFINDLFLSNVGYTLLHELHIPFLFLKTHQ